MSVDSATAQVQEQLRVHPAEWRDTSNEAHKART